MGVARDDEAIRLAEKIIASLDEGRRNTTYKLAVLHAVIDIALRRFGELGTGSGSTTTREIAERVLELYWNQVVPHPEAGRLKQGQANQDELAMCIERFRAEHPDVRTPGRARQLYLGAYEPLIDTIEAKIVKDPIPRLQRVGNETRPFLFDVPWSANSHPRGFKDYQRKRRGRGGWGDFDNRLLFFPGTEESLVKISGLIIPLIQRTWSAHVARWNRDRLGMTEEQLEAFLFEPRRGPVGEAREALREVQKGECFFCNGRLGQDAHVDHFVPWRRAREEAIENLVLADGRCNTSKSDHIAAPEHVRAWLERLDARRTELERIADDHGLDADRDRVIATAKGLYRALPRDTPLWVARGRFEAWDQDLSALSWGVDSRSG